MRLSRTGVRYGAVALVGSIAVCALVNQSGALAAPVSPHPAQDSVAAVSQLQAPPQAVPMAVVLPALSHLTIPTLGAAVTSQGYALRDVLVDASPDLANREIAFVLQRQDGASWTDVATGTTTGAEDRAVVANMPTGTYRVIVPEQYGMAEFVGAPVTHSPQQLSATMSFSSDDSATTVDINPDPTAGAFQFTLERDSGGTWSSVSSHTTSDAAGGFTFGDIPSGKYRVVVPDQADAIGTVSNEVSVTSATAQRAAAERATTASQRATTSRATSSGAASNTASEAPAADAPASADGGGIVGAGLAQVGDAYVRGGNGPNAFDCSGLTSYAYRAAGISIPRTAAAQYSAATKVSTPQPGDLVFYLNGAQHVGIYIGGGKMVHAATPGRGVEVSSISGGWYSRTFTGFGRF